jgi:transposase-like protein
VKIDTSDEGQEQELFLDSAEALRGHIRNQVHQALQQVFEEEIRELCGAHYHPASNEHYRAGSAPSYVMVEGHRESMSRPRVRRRLSESSSKEVDLRSWKLAQDTDEWEAAMMRAILCGVSTRKVPALRASEVSGESRSSLSRLWQRKSIELVEQMQQSDLSGMDLVIMMLDGVVLSDGLVATVALGIDSEGSKRVLGFRVGSSESAQVCKDLLSNLSRRGLSVDTDRRLLAVLDGSDALRKALLEIYPETLIQRCLVHKERNLKGYLSKRHWGELSRLFSRLRKAEGADQGKEALQAIELFLADKNKGARASLEEAGEELLALHRLNVPSSLNRSLLSTNCIENLFKNLRRHLGRVCRWRESTDQADRFLASGLILASEGFHKIAGHRDLPLLVKALQKQENETQKAA